MAAPRSLLLTTAALCLGLVAVASVSRAFVAAPQRAAPPTAHGLEAAALSSAVLAAPSAAHAEEAAAGSI
eukprot:CAMPEP_0197891356 /NCGR_PEP_ID=MMETSP1439-20131203/28249_1 /TAXON_ID=66791 /ORGANISM="Gonyaulax spinifera, Strain CCMP409" /LENGTH=69 /DNA_ID=CAMNT_0043511457 /DNA_START=79 /DNA_END=285 /DNA_ORIENTATION=-